MVQNGCQMEKVHPSRLMNISLLPIGQIKWMLQPLTSFPALDWGIRMFNMIPRTRTYKKRPLKISHAFPAISDFFLGGGSCYMLVQRVPASNGSLKKWPKPFHNLDGSTMIIIKHIISRKRRSKL